MLICFTDFVELNTWWIYYFLLFIFVHSQHNRVKSCNEQHFCAFLVLGLLQAALCTGFFTEWPKTWRRTIITSMGESGESGNFDGNWTNSHTNPPKNPGKWQKPPPPFCQCQDFGCIWTPNPSLSRTTNCPWNLDDTRNWAAINFLVDKHDKAKQSKSNRAILWWILMTTGRIIWNGIRVWVWADFWTY